MSGNFLTCLKGFKEPFGAQVGRWNFSRDATAENGLSSPCREILLVFLELRGFLSSYDWEFMDKLIGAQGVPVSTRVASYPSGFLSSRCRGRGPQLELRPEPQGSSQGRTWISGFLHGIHRGVRASSLVEPCKSALLLSQKSSVRLHVRLAIGIGGFLSRGHRAVTPAIVF